MSVDKEIELINEIVAQAVIHGGDSGGPYYTNSSVLYKTLRNWLIEECLIDEFKIVQKEYIDIDHRVRYPNMFTIVPQEDTTEEYHVPIPKIAF